MSSRYAVVIPACNEEPCIEAVVRELRRELDPRRFVVCAGVNGSSDRTAEIARRLGVIVGETSRRGYGYGCQTAIEELLESHGPVSGYIFFAADGANDPRDIAALVAEHERGAELVLGARTTLAANWPVMGWNHVFANRLLALWCGCLTGRWFADIGPLRLIGCELFRKLQLREWTFGWTIEAQVRAAILGARIVEIPVRERRRVAGTQKVSRVSWRHSLRIGAAIFSAGWRTRFQAPAPWAENEAAQPESDRVINAGPVGRGS